MDLHDLRSLEIMQSPKKTLIVFMKMIKYGVVSGRTGAIFQRSLSRDGTVIPSANGRTIRLSLLKRSGWMNELGWIMFGRPHTKDLRVEERFHRVNHDIMELTVTIIDPAYYTKPWNAPGIDIRCACNPTTLIFGKWFVPNLRLRHITKISLAVGGTHKAGRRYKIVTAIFSLRVLQRAVCKPRLLR